MNPAILSLVLRTERDVVLARQRARHIAELLGFDGQDQTRIATAVSEIARNAFAYARGGKVEFAIEGVTVPQLFVIRVADTGPGIAELATILEGRYRSATGMGVGIIGARRLMDNFEITAPPGGTTVVAPISSTMAGPATGAPPGSRSRSYTGVRIVWPPKYTARSARWASPIVPVTDQRGSVGFGTAPAAARRKLTISAAASRAWP